MVALELRRFDRLRSLDEISGVAEFDAGVAGAGEGFPFGGLGVQGRAARLGQAVVFARRAGRRFDQIGFDQAVGLHPPHQRVDGAFAHVDGVGQSGGDLIGVAVGSCEQG